jgi:cytochrome o ubiquinol oxidase operon protein cyoD
MRHKRQGATLVWLAVTGLLGAGFVGIELHEFANLIHQGNGPQRSAFLSSFTLVGTHGLRDLRYRLVDHADGAGKVRADRREPATADVPVDVLALPGRDLIGVFTFVYLMGALRDRTDRSCASLPVITATRTSDPTAAHHASGYVTGFVLAVVLTAIPFWLVMGKVFANSTVTTFVILGFAIVQIYVHMVFFLHDLESRGRLDMDVLIFTLTLVVIALSGSMWVMYHLKTNMMAPSPEQMRNIPDRVAGAH